MELEGEAVNIRGIDLRRGLATLILLTAGVATYSMVGSAGDASPYTSNDDGSAAIAGPLPDRHAVATTSCEIGAVPDRRDDDPRVQELFEVNEVSQAGREGSRAMSGAEAIALAKTVSSGPQGQVRNAPAFAVQVQYQTAEKWLSEEPGSNRLIAPERCIWVVEVAAPFKIRSGPIGADLDKPLGIYTVLLDSLSGEYIGVVAGTPIVDRAELADLVE